jgi:hypothetical protein
MSIRLHWSAAEWRGIIALAALLTVAITFLACGSSSMHQAAMAPPAPLAPAIKAPEPVLIYVGAGATGSDVTAIEGILKSLNLGYTAVDQTQLAAMTEPQLGGYKLMIVPGGDSIVIGQSVGATVPGVIRNAVMQYGMHYLGICAGAFFGGYSTYNGVDLTSGVGFDFYGDEFKGIHTEPVLITLADGGTLDIYWQDGPQLSGWGSVVAKFPDGTPAITEGSVGNGFVVFTGVHPEAPASWRSGLNFSTPESVDVAYAGTLIQAALSGSSLPHF